MIYIQKNKQEITFLIRPTCACKHLFIEQYKRCFHPAEKKSQHNSCIIYAKNLKSIYVMVIVMNNNR
jgi:hypothetical protein